MTLLKDAWDIIKDRAEWKTTQAQAAKVPELERRIAALESTINQKKTGGNVCDHCGSPDLVRIGNRPSAPPWDRLGKKDAVFRCNLCGMESSFLID